ncbi:MAG: HDOD domain-containing protein [Candidatus Hydrogenedens sp.]
METHINLKKAKEMLQKFKGLPTVPVVLSEALRITADPSVNYDKVIKIISQDPNLSGRLLRIANSPYYGLKHRVTNLQLALVILGIREFRCILIGSAVLDLMKFKNLQYQELYKKLWRESLFMASFCRELSQSLKLPYEGEDFLVGLLANIGASILLSEIPQKYFELMNQSHNNHKKQLELEQQQFGFIQTDIAHIFLEDWDIPPVLCDTIWHQYDIEYLPIDNAIDPQLSALLRLARYSLLEIQESVNYEEIIQKSFNILGSTFENCKDLWEEIKKSKQAILSQSKIEPDSLS